MSVELHFQWLCAIIPVGGGRLWGFVSAAQSYFRVGTSGDLFKLSQVLFIKCV